MQLTIETMPSPIGTLLCASDGRALRALDFHEDEQALEEALSKRYPKSEILPGRLPAAIRDAIGAYFDGDLTAIDRVPVETTGSEFQLRVWAALRAIPVGTTTTYGALAERIGSPGASRAVGLANGSNPIGLVVPCHRVIGADGSLTGYGGGLPRKRWLLQHEGVRVPAERQLELIS
jgi:methylated-DNA-[protein]-cysteine S-methyltransferase